MGKGNYFWNGGWVGRVIIINFKNRFIKVCDFRCFSLEPADFAGLGGGAFTVGSTVILVAGGVEDGFAGKALYRLGRFSKWLIAVST